MNRPLDANYWHIRRATELGDQLMMSGIVDVSDCVFPLLYFLLYRLPLAVSVST